MVDKRWYRVLIYSFILNVSKAVSNNQRVMHRAVSLQQHGS